MDKRTAKAKAVTSRNTENNGEITLDNVSAIAVLTVLKSALADEEFKADLDKASQRSMIHFSNMSAYAVQSIERQLEKNSK